jgi:hypothetical protein
MFSRYFIVFQPTDEGNGALSRTKDERTVLSLDIGSKPIQTQTQVYIFLIVPIRLFTCDTDYSFAKYNVQPAHYTYSQDEYMRFLEGKLDDGMPSYN